jgi:hypothetical protein
METALPELITVELSLVPESLDPPPSICGV